MALWKKYDGKGFFAEIAEKDQNGNNIAESIADLNTKITSLTSAIAPEFTSAANYSANENVMHKGSFYTCISAVSSGSDWDPDCWSATNVNALIGDVETLLAAL